MEMHQIRYFLAVNDTLNFTRAADDCNVSQPSLSRAVKKLEDELGGDLFRRERDRTHLTDLGRTMFPMLRQCYECAVAAKTQATSYGTSSFAPLRLGLSQSVALTAFSAKLEQLAEAFPGLELQLFRATAGSVLESLKDGDIEIAIVADRTTEWERFDSWPLFDEPFAVFAKNKPGDVTLADLAGQQAIARPYCESSNALSNMLAEVGTSPPQTHQAANDEDARAMVALGLGWTVLPLSSLTAGEEHGRIDLKRTVSAYVVAGRERSAAAATLLNLVRSADWSAIAA